jgi:hypothetical protein
LLDICPVNHSGPDSASPGLAHRIIIKSSSDPFHYSRLYFTSIIGFLIKDIFMRIQHEYLKQATPVFTKLQIRAASIRMQAPIAICSGNCGAVRKDAPSWCFKSLKVHSTHPVSRR